MSTSAFQDQEAGLQAVTSEEFNALEQRVLRAVEMLRTEREARATAEQNAAELEQRLQEQSAELARIQSQLSAHEGERGHVRQRIERMLKQLDEITA